MPDGYGTHKDYLEWVEDEAEERVNEIRESLLKAFKNHIEIKEVDVIVLSEVSASELAQAFVLYPSILKPILAVCNVAARAIERDLGIKNVNTYDPKLKEDDFKIIAGYIKPFLPTYLEVPSILTLDRHFYIDKEIRRIKGNWEKFIVEQINKISTITFVKRQFTYDGESFEIDAASLTKGDIKIGIDIKRIEARRDIHKRCDEIVNKAEKLKSAYPQSKFIAIIYYPFLSEHMNIRSRLKSDNIDEVIFASETPESVKDAIKLLSSMLKIRKESG